MMLYPKLILFTNDRVRNAPISGLVVRMADYYSASAGAEGSLELLEKKVKQGYSIVIFPEGTRSADGEMKRFHKGAFFLAEKMQLDIVPVIIHGSGYTMTKHDMLVKDGSITLKILPAFIRLMKIMEADIRKEQSGSAGISAQNMRRCADHCNNHPGTKSSCFTIIFIKVPCWNGICA